MKFERLIDLFRKKYTIPNLIICIGIFFFLTKVFFIWFGTGKELKIKLADINPVKENSFLLNRDISISDYEVVAKKNLFRPNRDEWVPPRPPPPPSPPKPSLLKPVPSPEIKVSGIIGAEEFSKRAILEGKYYTPVTLEKKEIKKKGYKLYEMIGQYRIDKIYNDRVVIIDQTGKVFEFYIKQNIIKMKNILNKPNKSKKKKLMGSAVKKWKPSADLRSSLSKKSQPHISGAETRNISKSVFSYQHISGN